MVVTAASLGSALATLQTSGGRQGLPYSLLCRRRGLLGAPSQNQRQTVHRDGAVLPPTDHLKADEAPCAATFPLAYQTRALTWLIPGLARLLLTQS